MSELAAQGLAVLMISSELPEILGMSDRILVMREGRIVGRVRRADADQETIAHAMMRVRCGRVTRLTSLSPALAASPGLLPPRLAQPGGGPAAGAGHPVRGRRRLSTRASWPSATSQTIFLGNAYVAVAAIGMSMVIISGNIDVSVGSLIGVLAVRLGLDRRRRLADLAELAGAGPGRAWPSPP